MPRITFPQVSRLLSLGLHVLVILLFIGLNMHRPSPARLPGTRSGSHVVLVYAPGQASPENSKATPKQHFPRKAHLRQPRQLLAKNKPAEHDSPLLQEDSAAKIDPNQGNDALGSGDIDIALMSYFPTPKPNLEKLPHGTAGDIVLDVVIDAAGKIVELKKTKGLGYGVDETVIATVQTWTFQPATRNGSPVPSEQELHFHYERG